MRKHERDQAGPDPRRAPSRPAEQGRQNGLSTGCTPFLTVRNGRTLTVRITRSMFDAHPLAIAAFAPLCMHPVHMPHPFRGGTPAASCEDCDSPRSALAHAAMAFPVQAALVACMLAAYGADDETAIYNPRHPINRTADPIRL